MKDCPVVAIIGRPNVGKSTLFNAFAGSRKSIVSEIAGTTRDSLMEKVETLGEHPYWLIDTAGLSDWKENTLESQIQIQVEIARKNADLILWMVDGKAPLTKDDYDIAERLRKDAVPLIFIANKIDDGDQARAWELTELGLGMPEILSAKNNFGFWDLVETLEKKLKDMGFPSHKEVEEAETKDYENEVIKVALVGRPNVGKSTLFNQLLGKERSVVSEVAGTTRDSIDERFTDEKGQEYLFIDTAGVRKRGKIEKNMEFWSYVRTTQSIERADVCLILIDALDGVTHQDLVLAGKVLDAGKGVVLVVNKFDLAREKARAKEETDERELEEVPMWDEDIADIRDRYLRYLKNRIGFLPWAPVLFLSGKTGKGTDMILPSAREIAKERQKRIPTNELNLVAEEIYYGHVAPSQGTKKGKIKYAMQPQTAPPKFLFFVNNVQAFHFSYKRYIENRLRDKYGFQGTPIVVELRDAMKDRKRGKQKEEEQED